MTVDGPRYQVLETDAALQDLTDIITYLTQQLKTKQAAQQVLQAYEQAVDALETFPFGFPLVQDQLFSFLGYRGIPVGSYVAFYAIDEVRHRVNIERVLHRCRNWTKLLSQEDETDDVA